MIKQTGKFIPFVTILVALLSFAFCVNVNAATFYVATNGSDTAPYDTWAKAATGIQTAIDAASDGDTIMVGSGGGHGTGVYTENVVVNKQLTINSESGYSTTTVAAADSEDNVFRVTADNVNISGFSVHGGTNMRIDQNGELFFPSGIFLSNVNSCTVENNRCGWDSTRQNSFGIRIVSSGKCIVRNNITSHNRGPGIAMDSSSGNTIASNIINYNSIDGFGVGFSSGNTFEGNSVSYNKLDGFIIGNSNGNIFKNNTASGNGFHGFQITDCTENTFAGNTANDNTIQGFYLVNSKKNTLDGDTANSNRGVGIGLDNSFENTVSSCTVTHNEYGIFMAGSSNNIITSNVMNENDGRVDGDGIMLTGCTNNTIEYNTMENDPGDGIEFYEASNNNIIGNTVIKSGWGIRINQESSNNVLSGNTVNDGVKGIILEDGRSVNNVLAYNITNNNSEDGIFLFDSTANNILIGNTAKNNTNHGIHINLDSEGNNIYLNNLIANQDNNVFLDSTNNLWRSPVPLNYNYNGGTVKQGYLGNYYSDGTHAGSGGIGGMYDLAGADTDDCQLINTSDNYYLQAWWLNNDGNMYFGNAGKSGGSDTISGGGTRVWISDRAAASDVSFPGSGSWTGQLVFTKAPLNGHTLVLDVGSSSNGSDFTAGGPSAVMTGDGISAGITFTTDTSAFTVPAGKHLAFRIKSSDAEYSIWTGGAWSFISSPENSSGFVLPVEGTDENRFEYSLEQNYPNPFNPATKIEYEIPVSGNVLLKVYNILGREMEVLVNKYQAQGKHSVLFDAGGYSNGVYFYRITSGKYSAIRKMILLK